MRQPSPSGTSVDIARKRRWENRFRHYRYPPSIEEISAFLSQFGSQHEDTAARVLDSVEVVTRVQIEVAFRALMENLPGWHIKKTKRNGTWRFVPYSFSSGESGDEMVHLFRQAMGMRTRFYDPLFIHPRDLVDQRLTSADTVVLLDDFSGSGAQACASWAKLFRELVGGAGTVYLMVIASTTQAQEEIKKRTELELVCYTNLNASDNFFAAECRHFSDQEKEVIEGICREYFPDAPRGFGDCGLLFVLHHDCPNNSIPLLHDSVPNRWHPLFARTHNVSK